MHHTTIGLIDTKTGTHIRRLDLNRFTINNFACRYGGVENNTAFCAAVDDYGFEFTGNLDGDSLTFVDVHLFVCVAYERMLFSVLEPSG